MYLLEWQIFILQFIGKCIYMDIKIILMVLKAFDVAYQDVEKAFKHYLKYFYKGNRIVLAGHSQGTHLLQKLFTDYLFKNDSILQKIELAYLIGDLSVKVSQQINSPCVKTLLI